MDTSDSLLITDMMERAYLLVDEVDLPPDKPPEMVFTSPLSAYHVHLSVQFPSDLLLSSPLASVVGCLLVSSSTPLLIQTF